jgi:NAD(P)-dependent dehydrogenase (short-subunit alcohol dehydrogenase family)
MARVVITGANRGIGLALVRECLRRGDEVIAACRKSSAELDQLGAEVVTGVDVARDEGVTRLARAVDGRPIDILINNAGVYRTDSLGRLDYDAIRDQLETNALGPIRVTAALLASLGPGAKVAIITSRSGSIGDNGSSGNYGYRMSKAAVNMAGVNLALDLKSRGIAVAILHPGMVRTGMGFSPQAVEPEGAARRLMARIDELTIEESGKFLHAEGYALPW